MPEVTLVEAVNLALARAMEEDANVVVLGEDVGVNGGVFRATVGLQQRFGAERVIDTPLSELLISGLCVGMAALRFRSEGERRSGDRGALLLAIGPAGRLVHVPGHGEPGQRRSRGGATAGAGDAHLDRRRDHQGHACLRERTSRPENVGEAK